MSTRKKTHTATGRAAQPAATAARYQAPPFADVLRQRQRNAGPRRKGERTRDRLKLAAVQVLEDRGYLRLRVSDICKRAKVSPAAFYLYFQNREEITVEVLTEFLHETFKLSSAPGSKRTAFEAIYDTNMLWILTTRANAGLMRCLLQLGDQVPEFKALHERINHEWFEHVTQRLLKRYGKQHVGHDALLLAIYALGGLMDEITRKALVDQDAYLQPVVQAAVPTDEAFAEFVSVLWYRAIFGTEPAPLRHAASRELLSFKPPQTQPGD